MNDEPLDQYLENQKQKFKNRQQAIARLAAALEQDSEKKKKQALYAKNGKNNNPDTGQSKSGATGRNHSK